MLDDVIRAGAEATLSWLTTKDPGLKQLLDKAYGYAVFPALGRASAVLGGARGHGEVFEEGNPIGFATLTQMTVGMQVGGQTFSELILFDNKDALETFKKGMVRFTANASTVFVRAGATRTTDFHAVVAKAYSRGGMLLEASLGGQKFTFHEHLTEKRTKREAALERESREGAARGAQGEGVAHVDATIAQSKEGVEPAPNREGSHDEAKAAEETPEESFEEAPEKWGYEGETVAEEARPEEFETAPEEGYGAEAAAEAAPPEEFETAQEEGEAEVAAEVAAPGEFETAPEEGYEAEAAAEDAPPDEFETAPEEGYEAEAAAEDAPPEEFETAPEEWGYEADAAEAGPEATRAIWRSHPQGHDGSAQEAEVVAKAGSGIRRRLAGTGRKLVGKVAHVASKRSARRGFKRIVLNLAAKRYPTLVGKPLRLLDRINAAATGIENEATLGPVLSAEVNAALRRMTDHDPGLNEMLDKAYGYALFPLVGKAAAALGIGFGRGQVFERGKLIGYAGMVQLTLGVQVGGETYDELIVFENEDALERFKDGKLAFAANASAVIVKAGAAATTNYSSGTAVFVHPEGGLMLELGSGIQRFMFRRKVLGAPEVKAPKVKAPEVQSKAPIADETRPVQSERAPPEVKATEAKAEGTTEEQKGGAAEVARTARARTKAAAAAARTKVAAAAARTKATAAAARTKATVGDAGTAVKRGIGALMRRPRSRT